MLTLLFLISVAAVFAGIYVSFVRIYPVGRDLNLAIAFALLLSVFGYLYYISLVLGIAYVLVLACPLIWAGLILFKHFRKQAAGGSDAAGFWPGGRSLFLTVALLLLTIKFFKYTHRWGDWDAWAIWTLHAKFLFYPEFWTNLFTDELAGTHPDYPLMLSSVIAFAWRGVGAVTALVPIGIANLVLVAVVASVFLALKRMNRTFPAYLSLFIFAFDTKFLQIAGSQYADTLVALFILSTFILYKEVRETPNFSLVVLLGWIAGSTSWVKNEGVLFFAVFSVLFFVFNLREPKKLLAYLAGGLLPALVLVHFKVYLAPDNDLVNPNRTQQLVDLVLNADRYLLIISRFAEMAVTYYWLLLVCFAIVVFRDRAGFKTLPFLVVSGMLAGYFFIFLITPNDLDWHLGASLDRLMHHLYPACIYLLLLRLSNKSEEAFPGQGFTWTSTVFRRQ